MIVFGVWGLPSQKNEEKNAFGHALKVPCCGLAGVGGYLGLLQENLASALILDVKWWPSCHSPFQEVLALSDFVSFVTKLYITTAPVLCHLAGIRECQR